jgi:hypothetical protein
MPPLRDHYLIRTRFVTVAPGDLVRQGFTQLGKACVGSVAGVARPRSLVGSVDDVRRGWKVGLPHLEVDDLGILPGQLHDLAYARDGHGTRDRRGMRNLVTDSSLLGAQWPSSFVYRRDTRPVVSGGPLRCLWGIETRRGEATGLLEAGSLRVRSGTPFMARAGSDLWSPVSHRPCFKPMIARATRRRFTNT